MLRKYCKFQIARMTCPKCDGHIRQILPFEGRPRLYCDQCEEMIIDQPWSAQTGYPQDVSLPSPSTLEGNN